MAPPAAARARERDAAGELARWRRRRPRERPAIVVLGGGRVGRVVIRAVRARGFRCVVVDRDQRALDEASKRARRRSSATRRAPRSCAGRALGEARLLVVAIGDALTARLAVERARAINPRLTVVSRARGRTESDGRSGTWA